MKIGVEMKIGVYTLTIYGALDKEVSATPYSIHNILKEARN
jgi:hypothetical protein